MSHVTVWVHIWRRLITADKHRLKPNQEAVSAKDSGAYPKQFAKWVAGVHLGVSVPIGSCKLNGQLPGHVINVLPETPPRQEPNVEFHTPAEPLDSSEASEDDAPIELREPNSIEQSELLRIHKRNRHIQAKSLYDRLRDQGRVVTMHQAIEAVKACKKCVKWAKFPKRPKRRLQATGDVGERMSADIGFLHGNAFLTIVDHATNYMFAAALDDHRSSEELFSAIQAAIQPLELEHVSQFIVDSERALNSQWIKDKMWEHGVHIICTPPKAKWSNGRAEVAVRILKLFLRRLREDDLMQDSDFPALLREAVKTRNLNTDFSGYAPSFKLLGVMPRLIGEPPDDLAETVEWPDSDGRLRASRMRRLRGILMLINEEHLAGEVDAEDHQPSHTPPLEIDDKVAYFHKGQRHSDATIVAVAPPTVYLDTGNTLLR